MPGHPHLPRPRARILDRRSILDSLSQLDSSSDSRQSILKLENSFRDRVLTTNLRLPANESKFDRFNTNPFVLLIHASRRDYVAVADIEEDLVLAKAFSSVETAAGKMVEDITLDHYGWTQSTSSMHSSYSIVDGATVRNGVGKFASLKSGPKCLNDTMAENYADSVLTHAPEWAENGEFSDIDFTYGVLYGTPKKSNKKDWHILRNIVEKAADYGAVVIESAEKRWSCQVQIGGTTVRSNVRIGLDWWEYLGGPTCALEVWVAMIRACIAPSMTSTSEGEYVIPDMASIVSTAAVSDSYNVSLLQRSQLPWLFFVARHFCDELA